MTFPVGRLLAALLVVGAFAAVFAGPASAGTKAHPEITDNATDQELTVPATVPPTLPAGQPGTAIDVIAAWIDNETATSLQMNIEVTGDPSPSSNYIFTYTFHVMIGTTSYEATATSGTVIPQVDDGAYTPSGVASNVSISGSVLSMKVLKSAIGNPAVGAVLSKMHVESNSQLVGQVPAFDDVAPDAGDASTAMYNITVGAGSGGAASTDSDGDGLNNTFEKQYFGNENSTETGTGDPDHDGLTNAQEQKAGTDPTKADTDGDGANDKAELDAGTNPKDPNSKPTAVPPPTTGGGGGTTTTPPATTPAGTVQGGGGSGAGGSNGGSDSADTTQCDATGGGLSDCFTGDNLGYIAVAAGMFLFLVIISLIALFGRWAV